MIAVGCILRFADEKDFWFACKYHPKNGSSYAGWCYFSPIFFCFYPNLSLLLFLLSSILDEDLQTFEDASDDELNIIERFFEEVCFLTYNPI